MAYTGRPTKYGIEIQRAASQYVNDCCMDSKMPYIEELALILDINDDTIVEWTKEHDQFSATIKKMKILQKLCLKRGALEKKLHSQMAIFLLKANHGLNEKEPDTQTEPVGFTIEFVGCTEKHDKLEVLESDSV